MRRKTPSVHVGSIQIGSDHPIVVQSMTNTCTSDIPKTVQQIIELASAGSELVRVTVNDDAAAKAIPDICHRLKDQGCTVPLVGDFHYNGHLLLEKYSDTASLLSKYRINPGNVGQGQHHEQNFAHIIELAKAHRKPVRIGVNWGSIDQALFTRLMDQNAKAQHPKSDREIVYDVMVESALTSAAKALELGLTKEQVILSVKMSSVPDMIAVNRLLAFKTDLVLHIGVTEAGGHVMGTVASTAGLTELLCKGIGDTIRVSITPEPGMPRSREVEICYALLQALELRFFKPIVTSCPGCGRTNSTYFIQLADDIRHFVDERLPIWKKSYPGVEKMVIAIMGCVVNGPGESKHATIGISLPGALENPIAPVYIEGRLTHRLAGADISEQFKKIIEDYLKSKNGVI